MSATGQRELNRDSLFLLADVRLDGVEGEHRVRVRNLSAGGMMADGAADASRGQTCQVSLRNVGWIDGTVAWVQDGRFGVAFREEIDPKEVRAPVVQGESTPDRFRRHGSGQPDPAQLRKV